MFSSDNGLYCSVDMTSTESGNYTWPSTTAGTTIQSKCDLGPSDGFASRSCDVQGNWMDVDGTTCNSLYNLLENVGALNTEWYTLIRIPVMCLLW